MFSKQYEYSPRVYRALWEVEQQVGAPRLRWVVRDQQKRFSLSGTHPSQYDPLTHTVYLLPVDPRQDLTAELAHAQQFTDTPVQSYLQGVESVLRIAIKSVSFQMSIEDAQDDEYRRTGSLEHEAHRVIEPSLERKLQE